MATLSGNRLTSSNLRSILDFKNEKCYIDGNTNWKLFSTVNNFIELPITIPSGSYNTSSKKSHLNGTNESIEIKKNEDNIIKWGKTISIYCSPITGSTGSYIFNDTNELILNYTDNNKIVLLCSPQSHKWYWYSAILIDSFNNITLIQYSQNYNPEYIKIDISGNIIGLKRDYINTHNYVYGKIIENNGELYLGHYRGYTKSTDFVESDVYTDYSNSTYMNWYMGDIDVDDNYIYSAASYYEHKAYKVPKINYTGTTTFGTGLPGSNDSTLNSPRGIAVGTNYVFISDTGNNRIMVLNKSDMTFNTKFGSRGSGDTNLDSPQNIAIKNGYLYIADKNNQKIKIYDEITLSYVSSLSVNMYPSFISINDTYLAIINEGGVSTQSVLKIFKLSDSSLILNKTFEIETGGVGNFVRYGSKAIRSFDGKIYSFDRNNKYFVIDPTTLTFGSQQSLSSNDQYDVAIDATYFYITWGDNYGIRKIRRSDNTIMYSLNSNGTGNSQFALNPQGIAVDNNYVYVADSSNNRIQIFNIADLSFVSKFGTLGSANDGTNFNYPTSIEIDNGYIYIADYSNNKIRKYDQTTLAHIASYTATNPYRMRIYGDEVFCWNNGTTLRVYDKTTFSLLRSKSYIQKQWFPGIYSIYNLEVSDTKIFLQDQFMIHIVDKTTLAIEGMFSVWYKTVIIDTPITETNVLIDIVFTDDYKVKVYANGIVSNEIQYTSNHSFSSLKKYVLGNTRTNYSNNSYMMLSFYDKAKTLKEHTNDYISLKKRF
jgi:hypothetical protein